MTWLKTRQLLHPTGLHATCNPPDVAVNITPVTLTGLCAAAFVLLLQLDREKIPERVVHARGMVAKGYFQVTVDTAGQLMHAAQHPAATVCTSSVHC
jgi:hypothetical protein